MMFRNFRLFPLISAMVLLAPVTSPGAAEIKVLNANALTIAMKELAADFTKETGHQVSFVGVSPGLVEQRIKAGEVYDLVITATASAAAFEQEGMAPAAAGAGRRFAVREASRSISPRSNHAQGPARRGRSSIATPPAAD
jgi:ABC-type molybdate transport system substrate-binding protein